MEEPAELALEQADNANWQKTSYTYNVQSKKTIVDEATNSYKKTTNKQFYNLVEIMFMKPI